MSGSGGVFQAVGDNMPWEAFLRRHGDAFGLHGFGDSLVVYLYG